MAKKLISVWLSLTIVLFSSISIYAEEYVQGDFFNKEVVINGSEIVNYNLQYPFFLYKDTTYIPLSPDMGKIFGFEATMDWESRTLKLLKTEVTQDTISTNWTKNNGYDIKLDVISGVKVVAYEELLNEEEKGAITTEGGIEDTSEQTEEISKEIDETEKDLKESDKASEEPENVSQKLEDDLQEVKVDSERFEDTPEVIEAPEMLVEEVDLEGMPILAKGKYLFIPLRAMKNSKVFNWDLYYDSYYGLCVSTIEGKTAKSFWNEAESRYNRGLVNYILNYNGRLSKTYAQDLVFMFKRASNVYNVDEKLLMAIAQKESTFTSTAVSRSGARGLMQIMPRTGANFGLTRQQLFDSRSNINVGACMIGTGITNYNGDKTRALSAYNQGSARVSRGTYSTAYATRVMSAYSGVQNFLSVNGYN